MIKTIPLLKKLIPLFLMTALTLSITETGFATAMLYMGGGLGLSVVIGDNNTNVDIGLAGPDNIVLDTKNLSHDLLTETHALMGIAKLFANQYYSGLELFAHYQPTEVSDQSSATRNDENNLDYQIFNQVSFKSPGVSYGVNWIQSLIYKSNFLFIAS